MFDVVKGLVLRAVDVKDADLMLSVYTLERGVISVYAKGVKNSKTNPPIAVNELSYTEFTLFESEDKIWMRSATLIRSFQPSEYNLTYLSLTTYFGEVLTAVATAENDPLLMRLMLNTLHALSLEKYDERLLKAAFEMRLLSVIGFMPSVTACRECGGRDGEFYFDVTSGTVCCFDCNKDSEEADFDDGERHLTVILTEGARRALEYCVHAPMERLFSFTLSGEDAELFSRAAEAYITHQLERSFNSLEYYHMMAGKILP